MSTSIYFMLFPFALIAAVMAYLISYDEWIHHYSTKKRTKKNCLGSSYFYSHFFHCYHIFFSLYTY